MSKQPVLTDYAGDDADSTGAAGNEAGSTGADGPPCASAAGCAAGNNAGPFYYLILYLYPYSFY